MKSIVKKKGSPETITVAKPFYGYLNNCNKGFSCCKMENSLLHSRLQINLAGLPSDYEDNIQFIHLWNVLRALCNSGSISNLNGSICKYTGGGYI